MWTVGRIVTVLLFAPIALPVYLHAAASQSSSCDGHLREESPKFRLARQIRNESMQSVILFVSITPRDITQDKLLTLSCSLGKTYARNQSFVLWLFDSYKAAKRFNPQGEGNDSATELAFRSFYSFSREENEQSFSWLPDPGNYASTVKIKLGPPPPLPSP